MEFKLTLPTSTVSNIITSTDHILSMFSPIPSLDYEQVEKDIQTYTTAISLNDKYVKEVGNLLETVKTGNGGNEITEIQQRNLGSCRWIFVNQISYFNDLIQTHKCWDALTAEQQLKQMLLFYYMDQLCKERRLVDRGHTEALVKLTDQLVRPCLLARHYRARVGTPMFWMKGWLP